MKASTGISRSWPETNFWPAARRAPFVVVLAGIDSSEIVDAALADPALTKAVIPTFEPACTPPCDALLWRLETASGDSLIRPGALRRHWHRAPYAMTLRLAQYQPGSMVPEILDEGTLGTRGRREAFKAAIDRLAMRFVRDAARGCGRGPAASVPAGAVHGPYGWLDAMRAKCNDCLRAEWWSVGTSSAPIERVLSGAGLGEITWYRTKAAHRCLADPFPWPGTNRILCQEMPLSNGAGRIVAVTETGGTLSPPAILLDDGSHRSYPCTFRDDDTVYCVPESTARGATRIYRLEEDGQFSPMCDPAPHARLADPTLFNRNGIYWLGCTDLDLGSHDNLCLFHAPAITGPWTPHLRWPVKIDIRGARSAGMPFDAGGRLFRPGQDCAATFGAAIAIHEITMLTETEFCESLITVLRPNQSGPFPHGLHTLVHDGERFWVDGKRFVLDLSVCGQKFLSRAPGVFSRVGVD
jgi:hypothetical protein